MLQETKNYISQYKFLFYLSWICLYLIFPAWIYLHTSFAEVLPNLKYPVARALVILGFMVYFYASTYIINRYFSLLNIDKPLIARVNDWPEVIKNHLWLVIVCCLSVFLQVYPLSFVEVGYLLDVFFLYDLSNEYWHKLFDVPIQYGFWSSLILLILIFKQKKMINSISNYISTKYSEYKSNYILKLLFTFFIFGIFTVYADIFPYSFLKTSPFLRYPPASKLLYLLNYYAFGVSHIGPRILQVILYLLSAVYLYRTIYLFSEKETALLGAMIYLFSPIIFLHASMTFYASGTVFFMILISFYFLRFIKDNSKRDLLLATYFIGIGFMYKREVLLMFIICFAYLVISRIRKRDLHSLIDFKILLLALITILPWLKIGPSVYKAVWTNLTTYYELLAYLLMIQSQMSWPILILFLVSVIFGLSYRKDDLFLFFGLCFVAYYFFFTLMEVGDINHRYAMALYPAIAVFISHFIFSITKRIPWKHSFRLVSIILTIYLIFLCLVPRSSTDLITFKYKDFEIQYYPIAEVSDWIRDRTNDDERILAIMPAYYSFYLDRFYAHKDKINPKRFIHYPPGAGKELINSLQSLRRYCHENKITYIMFPFGPKNTVIEIGGGHEVKYLKEKSREELVEVARFYYDDNYLFIYKYEENSDS